MKIYSVAVWNIDPLKRAGRKNVKLIAGLEGLYGIHHAYPKGVLVFFKSLNDAKRARNQMESARIRCGANLCVFQVGADGIPEFIGPAEEENSDAD